uniref:hypothetical protein n=1 Tax=Paractinoplanes polyasparticus TaxID=2856853 RepID=UPI001C8549E2|nr:hypothetical protein [Actinoplanes polyasparticus]
MAEPLTSEQANAVYDILVEHCGADDSDGPHLLMTSRGEFIFHQTDRVEREYRFQGALGFGGKFRRGGWSDRWSVDCYSEDLTAERGQMIGVTNAALRQLQQRVRS